MVGLGFDDKTLYKKCGIHKNHYKYYDQYLRTGDPIERNDAWDQTKKLDQASGVMVIGSQLFMQLLIYSYIDDY